jgi:hypothetical protein
MLQRFRMCTCQGSEGRWRGAKCQCCWWLPLLHVARKFWTRPCCDPRPMTVRDRGPVTVRRSGPEADDAVDPEAAEPPLKKGRAGSRAAEAAAARDLRRMLA